MTEPSLGTVLVSQSPEERFEEYLQSRGKRMTQQKRQLLKRVVARHEHFDAETLIEQLMSSDRAARIARATVYRFLKELVDAGLLREFQLDGRSVYEHDYGYPQHDHMYCKECQRLFEFHNEELLKLRDRIAGIHSFRVTGHRFIITGTCEDCRLAKRRVRRKVDRI
ncbi:MAG: Fur family transcriptional regulator [Pirellulaceae bacterium]